MFTVVGQHEALERAHWRERLHSAGPETSPQVRWMFPVLEGHVLLHWRHGLPFLARSHLGGVSVYRTQTDHNGVMFVQSNQGPQRVLPAWGRRRGNHTTGL